MATLINEAIKNGVTSLDGKLLIAKTIGDGFTKTYEGNHLFQVKKDGSDYQVFGAEIDPEKNELVLDEFPILFTEDGKYVKYVIKNADDPYHKPNLATDELADGDTLETQLLLAFIGFTHDYFSLAVYLDFIAEQAELDEFVPVGQDDADTGDTGTGSEAGSTASEAGSQASGATSQASGATSQASGAN